MGFVSFWCLINLVIIINIYVSIFFSLNFYFPFHYQYNVFKHLILEKQRRTKGEKKRRQLVFPKYTQNKTKYRNIHSCKKNINVYLLVNGIRGQLLRKKAPTNDICGWGFFKSDRTSLNVTCLQACVHLPQHQPIRRRCPPPPPPPLVVILSSPLPPSSSFRIMSIISGPNC